MYPVDQKHDESLPIKHETESEMVRRQNELVQKATKGIKLTWSEKRELAKVFSKTLIELTKETGKAISGAVQAKMKSDLELIVNLYEIKNIEHAESFKREIEVLLTIKEAQRQSAISIRKVQLISSMLTHIAILKENVEVMQGPPRETLLKAIDSVVDKTIQEIASMNVKIDNNNLFSFRR